MLERPQRVWSRLTSLLSRGNNIEEGHYAERLWAALLSPPLDTHDVAAVQRAAGSNVMRPEHKPFFPWLRGMLTRCVDEPSVERADPPGRDSSQPKAPPSRRLEEFFWHVPKANYISKWHHYFQHYETYLTKFRNTQPVLLEIVCRMPTNQASFALLT